MLKLMDIKLFILVHEEKKHNLIFNIFEQLQKNKNILIINCVRNNSIIWLLKQ